MVEQNRESHKTDFMVSVDAREGITTGISAYDRARTIRVLSDAHANPRDLVSPGHMFPLQAKEGGVAPLAPYFDRIRHAFLIGLQGNLIYRWNFSVRGFFSLFHLTVVFILWGAAFGGTERLGGFTLNQTLTYFVTLLLLQFFISAFNEDYQISEDIRNGLINQFLLKPMDYLAYRQWHWKHHRRYRKRYYRCI